MKIGILINDLKNSQNWELASINKLLEDSKIQIVLLLKTVNREYGSNFDFFFKREVSYIGDLFLRVHNLREPKLGQNIDNSLTLESLLLKPKVEIKKLSNMELGIGEIFTPTDLEKIDCLNLSVILNFDYESLKKLTWNLNSIPIWTLKYSGFFESDGKYAGIKEILSKDPNVSISLIKVNDPDRPRVTIDKSFCNLNVNLSSKKTFILIIENATSLLKKNLRLLNRDSQQVHQFETEYGNLPNLMDILLYLKVFYKKLLERQFSKIYSFFGKENNHWVLFLGKGNFLEVNISESVACKTPKGEFWADPFLFSYREQNYVFFEVYPYSTKKGKISCGRIEKNEIIDVVDVFDFDYHLSYPFIFEEEGEIYMMPESFENKKLEIFRCVSFPNKWELYSSAFHDEEVVDTTYYLDKFNQKWLFMNKRSSLNSTFDSELYIYKIDSLKLNNIVPHNQNPVLIDARVARNGGAIFEYNGNYYRPSQRNTNGIYGEGLNINLIKKLTIDEYQESPVRILQPDFKKGLVGIHHLHQMNDLFVFDAAYKRY